MLVCSVSVYARSAPSVFGLTAVSNPFPVAAVPVLHRSGLCAV